MPDTAEAEYNALRAEIVAHSNAQNSLMALVVTAIGIVGGFVLGKEGTSHIELLLILPFLVCAAGIQYLEHSRAVGLLGRYILKRLTAYAGWEEAVEGVRGDRGGVHRALWLFTSTVPSLLVFVLGSAVPLWIVHSKQDSATFNWEAYDRVWRIGCGVTILFVVLAIAHIVLRRWYPEPFEEREKPA